MLETQFEKYIKQCRWFGGKGKTIKKLNIKEVITLPFHSNIYTDPKKYSCIVSGLSEAKLKDLQTYRRASNNTNWYYELFIIEITYANGENDCYLMPVGFDEHQPEKGTITELNYKNEHCFLYEAIFDQNFRRLLLELINNNEVIQTGKCSLTALHGKKYSLILKNNRVPAGSAISQVQQSNTSFSYEDILFLKLFRRLQNGIHPEEQMVKYLTEQTNFDKVPAFAGSIKWQSSQAEMGTIALLQEYVKNKGDSWTYFTQNINLSVNNAVNQSPYAQTEELLDPLFIQHIDLLGKITAQLHSALAARCDDIEIDPEPVSNDYKIYLYESVSNLAHKVFDELNFSQLGDLIKNDIAILISLKDKIFEKIDTIKYIELTGRLIRTHGDYHLGQVLFTGDDFIITDFEGEPTRSFIERKQKHLALRDISGMIRSFHYASFIPVIEKSIHDPEKQASWTAKWFQYVTERFLNSYFSSLSRTDFLPDTPQELEYMLDFYMLEKAIYELDYEIHHRPAWLIVAANGIYQIINKKTGIHNFPKEIFERS